MHRGRLKAKRRVSALVLSGALVAAGMAALPATSAGAAAPGGHNMYTRSSTDEFLGYPRVIQLKHSGALNGTLVGTFEHASVSGGSSDFVIRTSRDNGASWRTISTVGDPVTGSGHPASDFWQPFLLELPRPVAGYPAGTLILVGNIHDHNTNSDFMLWRSTDHGRTWKYQSVIQHGGGTEGVTNGIWEPFLTVNSHGQLAMYFSDERDYKAHSQTIVHIVSNDAGATWSAKPDGSTNFAPGLVGDVVSTRATDRPGMPTVATMGNGKMALAYELCGGTERTCAAHFKISTDGGRTWGAGASDLGTEVVTTDGRYPAASPYIAWTPAGGPEGQLMLTAWRTQSMATDQTTPENHQTIFVNTHSGQGRWSWMPTGFSPRDGSDPNCKTSYSQSLLPTHGGMHVRFTSETAIGSSGCAEESVDQSVGALPFRASIQPQHAGWITYAGSWKSARGVLTATSATTRGSRAITGSTNWSDYTLSGQVRTQEGQQADAGFLVRATNPTGGANGAEGYYVRLTDNTLTISRQHNGTATVLARQRMTAPGGNQWYQLEAQVRGRTITATAAPAGRPAHATRLQVTDDTSGLRSGAIGVQSGAGTASWRDINVLPS